MENPICSGGFGTASMTVLTIINCISGILTAGGNALVLIAILRTPSLRVASNVFIGSLAAADLTIGLVMNPIYAAIVCLNITDTTHPLNVAEQYLWIHTVITTTFNLAGMSVERYIAVIHPLHYPRVVTAQRTVIAVVAIWCFSFLFVSARAFINQPRDIMTLWIAHSVIAIAFPLAINPLVYSIRMRDFRAAIKRICRLANCCRNNAEENVHTISL
ncbi:beta-3 adrenergic receptor-like [Oculina patagonica]